MGFLQDRTTQNSKKIASNSGKQPSALRQLLRTWCSQRWSHREAGKGTATVFSVKPPELLASPRGPMLQHGVEHGQQLSHGRRGHDLLGFPGCAQAVGEHANDGIE